MDIIRLDGLSSELFDRADSADSTTVIRSILVHWDSRCAMSGRLGRVGAQLGASAPAVCRPCAPLPMPSSDEIAKQMARCIEVSKAAGERGDGPYLLRTIYMRHFQF